MNEVIYTGIMATFNGENDVFQPVDFANIMRRLIHQ